MNLTWRAPGKTFLLGEYAVLWGAPALVVTTEPSFSLRVRSSESLGDRIPTVHGIHPSSPAGQWMRGQTTLFSHLDLEFSDPYSGRGGLGASSAQFALVWGAGRFAQKMEVSPQECWRDYQSLFFSESGKLGISPSGADVVAQMLGGVTEFQAEPWLARPWPWQFTGELSFSLVRTGSKLATHEHLQSGLQLRSHESEARALSQLAELGREAFLESDAERFLGAFGDFGAALSRANLVAPRTREILGLAAAERCILAAKGCGAMGADLVMLLSRPEHRDQVKSWALKKDLEWVAGEENLALGLSREEMLPATGGESHVLG